MPLDEIYSTWSVIKIVAGVDLILGPVLTFVVFDIAKKRAVLARDLLIIFCVQLFALFWGGYTAQAARPLYVTFFNSSVLLISKQDFNKIKLKPAVSPPSIFERPKYVYMLPPKDSQEYKQLLEDIYYKDAPDVPMRVDRYRPLSGYLDRALKYRLDIHKLKAKNPESQHIINAYKASGGVIDDTVVLMPIKGSSIRKTAVIDRQTGSIKDIISSIDY